jgi:hypothetical protein
MEKPVSAKITAQTFYNKKPPRLAARAAPESSKKITIRMFGG